MAKDLPEEEEKENKPNRRREERRVGSLMRETKRLKVEREEKSINRYYFFLFFGTCVSFLLLFHAEVHISFSFLKNTLHCVCPLFDSTFCSNIKINN